MEAWPSKGCAAGIRVVDSSEALTRSAMVSVTAENAGGDSVHPMGSLVGIATSFLCNGVEKGTASLRAPVGVRWS